jgi:DNA primase catalytic subunit
MILGRHSGIYLTEFEEIKNKVVIIDEYEDIEDLRDYILRYIPEGVYYDRNVYSDIEKCRECEDCYKKCMECECYLGQELAFDIDPENVKCPIHGSFKDKVEKGMGLSFCMHEFETVKNSTLKLWEKLEKSFNYLRLVFSGRGFHIHVLDDIAVKMSYEERKEIAEKTSMYFIDEWVTTGGSRLIRLPYSLNGLVSRVVLPLRIDEVPSFDPRYDERCIPEFAGGGDG